MADARAIEFGRAEAMRLGCQVMAERTCDATAERLGKHWRPDDRDAMVSAITYSLVEAFAQASASRGAEGERARGCESLRHSVRHALMQCPEFVGRMAEGHEAAEMVLRYLRTDGLLIDAADDPGLRADVSKALANLDAEIEAELATDAVAWQFVDDVRLALSDHVTTPAPETEPRGAEGERVRLGKLPHSKRWHEVAEGHEYVETRWASLDAEGDNHALTVAFKDLAGEVAAVPEGEQAEEIDR